MSYQVKSNEVAIILRPREDEEGIDVNMIIGKDISNTEDLGVEMVDIAISMSASCIAIREDDDLREALEDYKLELAKSMFPKEYDEAITQIEEENKDNTVVKNGNVLSLNKWTKTEGTA